MNTSYSILLLPKSTKKLIFLHFYLHDCYIFMTNIEHSMASYDMLRGVGEKKGPKRPLKLLKNRKIMQYLPQDLLVSPLLAYLHGRHDVVLLQLVVPVVYPHDELLHGAYLHLHHVHMTRLLHH